MLSTLTNNQILKNCLTDKFLDSVEKILLPAVEEKWGKADIHMYEDLLRSELLIDGRWYYPLTVLSSDEPKVQWISWAVTASDFKDKNPYAYTGKGSIDFELCDIPEGLREKFSDYLGYSGKVGIGISVEAVARDITFLSGRYSQRFVDEMSRQITERISSLMSCEGLEDSTLSLLMAFAPESYFEHTSENVTYRRLLLIDRGSQPRDFWVKWTRLNSAVGYSVSDDVRDSDIEFDLGEDVPQKIREKEYRFLLREGREKYQNAMGRKNVTEWREIIRRAIKRGELQKIEPTEQEIVFEDDISAKLKSILGDSYKPEPKEPVAEETPLGDDYVKALEIAKGIVNAENQEAVDDTTEIVFPELDSGEVLLELGEPSVEAEAEAKEEKGDIFDLPWLEPAEEATEEKDEPTLEIPAEPLQLEPVVEEEKAEEPEAYEPEVCEEPVFGEAKVKVVKTFGEVSMKPDDSPSAALREAEARAGELSIRLEYEKQMRERLEAEIERLRQGEKRLTEENDRLRADIKANEAKYREAEESYKLEITRLTAQNEILARSEERQKERLATAARDAVERQKLLEEEKRHAEAERARLEREMQEAPVPAPAAPTTTPAPTPAPSPAEPTEPASEPESDSYTYVSKNVKLLFRRPVDPNITGRIYEIIKATLEYFGKEKVNLRIKASVPDSETVNLEFTSIPMEEMQLLSNIIQVLGSSGLGIAKAIVD